MGNEGGFGSRGDGRGVRLWLGGAGGRLGYFEGSDYDGGASL